MKTPLTNLIDDDEIDDLNEELFNKYGYDFSDYSRASLKRRFSRFLTKYSLKSYAELKEAVLNDETFFNAFLEEITVNVTEMFRDPDFYKALRDEVIPVLSTYPVIRIWHAGCSTGEEVYSMAILLHEAGILEKSLLYATDINQSVLKQAKEGIFPIENMKEYTQNYELSGGQKELSSYFVTSCGKAHFNPELSKKMVFTPHNLVFDQSFNEFNLIICRNVLIYFNQKLQNKVIQLFKSSLAPFGILALGTKEDIQFTDSAQYFEILNKKQKIWIKK